MHTSILDTHLHWYQLYSKTDLGTKGTVPSFLPSSLYPFLFLRLFCSFLSLPFAVFLLKPCSTSLSLFSFLSLTLLTSLISTADKLLHFSPSLLWCSQALALCTIFALLHILDLAQQTDTYDLQPYCYAADTKIYGSFRANCRIAFLPALPKLRRVVLLSWRNYALSVLPSATQFSRRFSWHWFCWGWTKALWP